MNAPGPGGLGGTYAGNPLSCAAGLAGLAVRGSTSAGTRNPAWGTTARLPALVSIRLPADWRRARAGTDDRHGGCARVYERNGFVVTNHDYVYRKTFSLGA